MKFAQLHLVGQLVTTQLLRNHSICGTFLPLISAVANKAKCFIYPCFDERFNTYLGLTSHIFGSTVVPRRADVWCTI